MDRRATARIAYVHTRRNGMTQTSGKNTSAPAAKAGPDSVKKNGAAAVKKTAATAKKSPASAKKSAAASAQKTSRAPKKHVSTVYFAGLRARNPKENKAAKIQKLFDAAGFASRIPQDALTAVKVHVGERGNDTFMNPVLVRAVVDKVKACGGKPFLTDSNTLYKGCRHNAVDHLQLALEHGFSEAVAGAPFIVADGLRGRSYEEVAICKKHFASVKIASAVADAQAMLVISHFKGHELAGFGGAIKNLAMGCSPSEGKCEQHATHFYITEKTCVGCGRCIASCPRTAIAFTKKGSRKIAVIDPERCIGCGECLTVCPTKAVAIDWKTELVPFTERMVEYAYGAVKGKEHRTCYVTFLVNITPDCDCVPWSDAPMVPDIGILASTDPVALDKACYDLVNASEGLARTHLRSGLAKGEDKFKGAWSYTTGDVQISYAEHIGLGSGNYELVTV